MSDVLDQALARLAAAEPPDEAWLRAEAGRLLDGAAASVTGEPGFGWLGDDGRPDPSRPRPLWVAARMTHLFALGHLLGRDGDGARADHGVASLTGAFADPLHGGWFAALSPEGAPPESGPDTDKGAYDHVFVLLAASSAVAAGRPGADELLAAAAEVVGTRFWADDEGAMRERWDREWHRAEPYRGANANMHAVEALLAAADVTGDPVHRQRALRIADRIVAVAAGTSWRIPEHFDEGWRSLPEYNRDRPDDPFRPFGATPGHGFEWARLLVDLDAALRRAGEEPPPFLLTGAGSLFARALADGWDGSGLVYTTGWDGVPVVGRHFHWVACEAIAAADALGRATGDDRYRAAYGALWAYARTAFVEPAGGIGWVHELDEQNRPVAVTWSGRPDVYHAAQAVLLPLLPPAPTLATALREAR